MSGLEQRKERWAGWPYRSAQNGFATGRNSAPEVGRVAIVPDRQKYCLRLLRRPDTQTEPGMQLRGILAPRGKRRSVLRRAGTLREEPAAPPGQGGSAIAQGWPRGPGLLPLQQSGPQVHSSTLSGWDQPLGTYDLRIVEK